MTEPDSFERATSQGHVLSDQVHLDGHFALAQPEYEAMLKSVGLQPGWHVLDAGCGVGSFLPLMSELVGAGGRISALDLAPENIEIVKARAGSGQYACPVETQIGSITELPYEDDTFDALWCTSVVQYLSDTELEHSLAEFRRVVRPGGLVAVKDFDVASWFFWPPGPMLMWHLGETNQRRADAYTLQVLRNIELPIWLRRAGIVNIRARTTLVERSAPLKPAEQSYLKGVLKWLASLALVCNLPEDELAIWRKLSDVDAPDHITDHPDFYYREGHIVVIGQVP